MKIKLSEITHTKPQREHGSIEELKKSIKEVGLINPITINQTKKLLAGRRRFQAIKELGWKEIECRVLNSKDQLFDFKVAIEENLKRKPLTELEVANSIKEYDELKRKIEGEKKPQDTLKKGSRMPQDSEREGWTQDKTAKDLGISRQATQQAIQIAKIVEEKPEYAKIKSGTKILQEYKQSKLKTQPLPNGKYRVIYADPPWQFNNSGFSQSAKSHYPTMPVEKICQLPIQKLTVGNSVLFLWATNAMLQEALQVCKAWGFNYKSNFVWIKNRGPSIGWFVESRHEILLIATKGTGTHPKRKFPSWFMSSTSKHSQKPDKVYEMIEKMYSGPYIELFARQERKEWKNYGNEISKN